MKRCKTFCLRSLWLSVTFHVKFNFILKFCLFVSLLRLWNICETCNNRVCWTVPHHTWHRTHSNSYICTLTGRSMDHETVQYYIFVTTSESRQPSTRWFGSGLYKLLSVFAKLYAPHTPIFYITTSAITETTVKQRLFAFICSALTLSDQHYL